VNFIRLEDLSEIEMDFLFIFRKSKTLDTLDIQCELQETRNKGDKKKLDAINRAWCLREIELKNSGARVFRDK
jgi:hypothetical protein